MKRTSMNSGESSALAVMAANSLFKIYYKQEDWPLELLELYLDDSLGKRQWVDSSETETFCKNLTCWTIPRSSTTAALASNPSELSSFSSMSSALKPSSARRTSTASDVLSAVKEVPSSSDEFKSPQQYQESRKEKIEIQENKANEKAAILKRISSSSEGGSSSGEEEVLEDSAEVKYE
jgi:hypothetical protein